MRRGLIIDDVPSIISAALFANCAAGGTVLSCDNSSTLSVILGRLIEDLLVIGFRNKSFISSSTFVVAVAVNAIMGTVGKSDFLNFLSSLNAHLKSLHSVNKCASSMAIKDNLFARSGECINTWLEGLVTHSGVTNMRCSLLSGFNARDSTCLSSCAEPK